MLSDLCYSIRYCFPYFEIDATSGSMADAYLGNVEKYRENIFINSYLNDAN